MIALLWLSLAYAGACEEPYSRIQFGAAVGSVQDAYVAGAVKDSASLLQQIGERVPCSDHVVDPLLMAQFARFMSLSFFYQQDEDSAANWAVTSKLSGELLWDDRFYPEAFQTLFDEAEIPPMGRAEGQGVAPPAGGGVFLDGKLLNEATAVASVPHLLQVFDRDQHLVGAYWQTGAAFAPGVLGRDRAPRKPSWWRGDAVSSAAVGGASGKKLPVVPLAVSGGLVVVSGLTYALASAAQGSMSDATTSQELTSARSTANSMVMISGVALAGAVGVGVTGVLVSSEPTGISLHLRF